MKVFIPRELWLRGEGANVSALHRPSDNKSCCLGHVLMAAGLPKTALTGISTPAEVVNYHDKRYDTSLVPEGLIRKHPYADSLPGIPEGYRGNTDLASQLMNTNDSKVATDKFREAHIIELLAEIGIEVTFG